MEHARAAAGAGQVDVLGWLHARADLDSPGISTAAAEGNQLDTLRWLQAVCDPPCHCSHRTMSAAASRGHLDIMKYLRTLEPPYPWGTAACRGAIKFPGCLKWLRQQEPSCPWDAGCFALAAAQGQLSLMQWMRAQEPPCPMDSSAMVATTKNNDPGMLKWVRTNDPLSPWDAKCIGRAAGHGNLEMVQYLCRQSPPCPWNDSAVFGAALLGEEASLEILQFMLQNDAPYDPELTSASAYKGNMATLQWVHGAGYRLSPRCPTCAAQFGSYTPVGLVAQHRNATGGSWPSLCVQVACSKLDVLGQPPATPVS